MANIKHNNACFFLISARKNVLYTCLSHLDKNYNFQYNYPILIFYHGNKYDDVDYQTEIHKINKKTKVSFHKIEAKLPEHLSEKDLFYNKTDVPYVKKSFSRDRMGYLHANYFWNNFMNYPELKDYQYMIRIDDDSWFKKKIKMNFFDELIKSKKLVGCGYTWNHVHHRVLDTRINFYEWIKDYVKKYNITVKNLKLKLYLDEGERDIVDGRKCNKNFHSMDFLCGNFNIYDRKMFETKEWKQYLNEFNILGGGYRYRWGDCEVISMFYYIHMGDSFLDLELKKKNIYANTLPNTKMIKKGLE
jgi:hypothetical protein